LWGDNKQCKNRCFEGQCCSSFWNPTIIGENSVTLESTLDDETGGLSWPSKDTALRYQEFRGVFKNYTDFHEFPLDSQKLKIELVIPDM